MFGLANAFHVLEHGLDYYEDLVTDTRTGEKFEEELESAEVGFNLSFYGTPKGF